jgi:hypothetical protein
LPSYAVYPVGAKRRLKSVSVVQAVLLLLPLSVFVAPGVLDDEHPLMITAASDAATNTPHLKLRTVIVDSFQGDGS